MNEKKQKIFAVLATAAVVTACAALPASAGKDGWTNLGLNAKREQRLAARASVTQCISRHAETSLGASAEV